MPFHLTKTLHPCKDEYVNGSTHNSSAGLDHHVRYKAESVEQVLIHAGHATLPLKLDYSINAVYLDSIRINCDVTGFYSVKSEFISF